MYTANQPVLVGESLQQAAQRMTLFRAERPQQRRLVLERYLADPLENFPTMLCQVQGIETPVIGIGPALHESPLLEVVEDRHQAAGVNAKPGGKLLLAEPRSHAEQAQNPRVRRRKPQNFQSFRELRSGIGSKLGQKEGWLSLFHLSVTHLQIIIALIINLVYK